MKRALLAPESDVNVPETLPPPWPGRPVTIDGTRTFVRYTPARAQAAEPALYVHGLGGSANNWIDLAYLMADRWDGHAIDLPGFGQSDPGHRYTIAALANRVIRYLEHSDRGPVHLVGNSLGGSVSVRVAGLRPDLVRTLTLVSPAMPFLDPRRSAQGRFAPFVLLPFANRLAAWRMGAMPIDDMFTMVIAACFAEPEALPEQRRIDARKEIELRYSVPHYPAAYVGCLRGLVTSFLRAYLPGANSLWRIAAKVTAPTLVIGGAHDQLVDTRVPAQVAKAIPDSRLLMLDNAGHVAQIERPQIVARAILGMLGENSEERAISTKSN
ncbi:alpha/beta fold hydrolase [Virgisporangium ochraceum]|uniref:Hydrolase n=1 Tax=Virgisporangium ochraceum TaxID=65505 RepID=A0A8J3ZJJ5_9ACTN|nr:alpha/beta hydrolase [Virgisporangium ochraceum]GIJ65419.1 hydrolase [Virgisporangium ochraceum]